MTAIPDRVPRPIIVLGAPRSGTTVFSDLLEVHPDVALAREPRLVWRFGNDGRSDQLRPAHARPEVVEHVHAAFADLLAERGATRLVEKTPANSVRPRFVDAVFPDALYVHITRNGWGAVPSMRTFWERRGTGFDAKQVRKVRRRLREARPAQLRHYATEVLGRLRPGSTGALYGPRLAGLPAVVRELGRLEASALQWRTCVEQSTAFGRSLPADRYLEISLESLDADVFAGVLAFCGLRPAPEVVEAFGQRYDPVAALRRGALTRAEQELLAPYVEPVNAWLGYETEPEPEPEPEPGAGAGVVR